ncbi:integrase [Chryseotalea sanaruensis]|uniref:Integrase n=1 Tax=Chryseotalea sanaruensis TaxID=2482724 RepID=A0A401UFR0_9BACT|nr:tyrosine-type recombinase/integrase [Chryseotalea sanaruensis]GCC53716.1 integrase [Chryseotalea sanaruensis]
MELKQYLTKRFTKRTAHCYGLMIESYTNQTRNAAQAKYKDILHYLEKRRTEGRQAGTLHTYLAAIKAYYDWLKKSGRRKDHPCKHLRLKDKIDHRISVQDLFTSTELELLLEQPSREINKLPSIRLRDKVIISLLIYQGLTTKNIVNLEVKDLNLEQATIYIKKATTLNARTLELHPKQIMLINRYLVEERPILNSKQTDKLILTRRYKPESGSGVGKVVKPYKKLFPDKDLTALAIRQSVIANLLKAEKDIRSVQVFAGHKSPMTTERYQQTGIEELTAAVMKFHPLK